MSGGKVASVCCSVVGDERASNPWLSGDGPRGGAYDERFARLAAQGRDVHGEADLVASYGVRSVLDAGCGTGRVAIELARRGCDVAGVDLDRQMLAVAREKAPQLVWVEADLEEVDLGRRFEAVVMAGNVMIFVTPGTEAAVVANMARHLDPGGLLIAGFTIRADRVSVDLYDEAAAAAGLDLADRWATWDRRPWSSDGDYAVSIHVRS
jgi:SAM-dependent methyltransferase